MPLPDFINITDADLSLGGSVNLLLASIAYEEFALANLINAEAEKVQYILGSLEGQIPPDPPATLDEILEVNRSADQTLRDIIKKEILLQLKLENVLDIPTDATITTAAVTSAAVPAPNSATAAATTTAPDTSTSAAAPSDLAVQEAWVVGTGFGTGCAQYTTSNLGELCKAVSLNLSCRSVPVGTVRIVRCETDLVVTTSVVESFLMDQVYLYVGNVPPAADNPEDFPYRFAVTDPDDYFKHYTFTIDVSEFTEQTLYISVFARMVS